MKSSSSSTEFLMHLSTFIETQFKGRMMLLPPFTYTQSTDLQKWERRYQKILTLWGLNIYFI